MIKTLLKNIRFLCKKNLNNLSYETLLKVEEMIEYGELTCANNIPNILDYSETLDLLLKEPKSFCRIGDGEINIIVGQSIPFQKYDKRLADYLKKIIEYDINECYVGINYNYFHSIKNLNDFNKRFYLLNITKYRKYLLEHCDMKKTYISAAFNQVYMIFESFDYEQHYKKMIEMIKDKHIVIFCGKNVFNEINYNIFDFADSVEYIECASRNSFEQFDDILRKCKTIPKEKILAFILGPTSKALVFELSKCGYVAWDIGHLAKDYDYYMKNIERNPENINKFFKPE